MDVVMSILLAPPVVDPGVTDNERRTVAEMMAKGTTVGSSWPQRTSTGPSKGFRPAAPRSSRSQWRRTMGFATAPSGIPRVTSSASRSGAERSARRLIGRLRDQSQSAAGTQEAHGFRGVAFSRRES
jgi:hypothetical protein